MGRKKKETKEVIQSAPPQVPENLPELYSKPYGTLKFHQRYCLIDDIKASTYQKLPYRRAIPDGSALLEKVKDTDVLTHDQAFDIEPQEEKLEVPEIQKEEAVASSSEASPEVPKKKRGRPRKIAV